MITNKLDPVIVQALANVFPEATQIDYLGEGSFGVTYSLLEPSGQSAIKILKPPFNIARTEREIQCLALVKSPYVSKFVDHGSFMLGATELRFFRTELLNGRSLRDRLQIGALPYPDLLRLTKHMSRALAALHDQRLTHRDLKPENIMLEGQRFVIIDLGFAKIDGAPSITIGGEFVGTLVYAALEQLISAKHVDIRADLFSLGMLAFESSRGSAQLAFHAGRGQSRAECIQNLLHVPLPSMAPLGPLGGVVSKLLAIQAYNRTNSPQALIADLGGL